MMPHQSARLFVLLSLFILLAPGCTAAPAITPASLEKTREVAALTQAAPTATSAIAAPTPTNPVPTAPPPPPPTATRAATPTTAPTVAPTFTPEPTNIPRPELNRAFYTYGGIKDFGPGGNVPPTKEIATKPMVLTKEGGQYAGLFFITYRTYYEGIKGYQIQRGILPFEGKAIGDVYNSSGFFREATGVDWVDQASGIFQILIPFKNKSGVSGTLRIKFSGDNTVLDHVGPGKDLSGPMFYQVVNESGQPAKANPGIVRPGDVVGIGGLKPDIAQWIQAQIDAATVSGQLVPVTAVGNKEVSLIIISE